MLTGFALHASPAQSVAGLFKRDSSSTHPEHLYLCGKLGT